MAFTTEYDFTLPRGYVDSEGNLYKKGIMKLATAIDEIEPMRDRRVQANPAYLNILLLSRVVVTLGELEVIDEKVIESLFAADIAYLQEFYARINQLENPNFTVGCPKCNHKFEVPFDFFQEEE